jgi:hypothetical protein
MRVAGGEVAGAARTGAAGNATHFVVFDAAATAQENGMLIAYATADGELATDVGAGAGPYAKVLAEEVIKPGIEAVAVFRIVQRRVRAAIRQEPYLGFSALGDVDFGGQWRTGESSAAGAEIDRGRAGLGQNQGHDELSGA